MADEETEDLEYHVTFPTAISPEDGSERDIHQPLSGRREPVVILLGWLGCEDRHLSNYGAIYHCNGFTTVRYTAPSESILSQPPKTKDIARNILELVFDLGLVENVIFFHIFSNSGCNIYRYVMQILHDPVRGGEFAEINVAGCVYDSAPCALPSKSYLVQIARNGADETTGYLAKFVIAVVLFIVGVLSAFFPFLCKDYKAQTTLMKDIKADPSRHPQLFLYSKSDDVCSWRDVDSVVEERRKRHVEVQQVCWDNSKHCGHLVAHRDEYIYKCQEFVQDCLLRFMHRPK